MVKNKKIFLILILNLIIIFTGMSYFEDIEAEDSELVNLGICWDPYLGNAMYYGENVSDSRVMDDVQPIDGMESVISRHENVAGYGDSDNYEEAENDPGSGARMTDSDKNTLKNIPDGARVTDESGNIQNLTVTGVVATYVSAVWDPYNHDYYNTWNEYKNNRIPPEDVITVELKKIGENIWEHDGFQEMIKNLGVASLVDLTLLAEGENGKQWKIPLVISDQVWYYTNEEGKIAFKTKVMLQAGETGGGGKTEITPPKPTGEHWSNSHIPGMTAELNGGQYDISQGIPTSEMLNGSISVDDIGYEYIITKSSQTIYYSAKAYISWDYVPGHWETESYTDRIIVGWDKHGNPHWEEVTEERDIWISPYYKRYEETSVTGSYTTHFFVVNYATLSILESAILTNDAVGTICTAGPSGANGYVINCGGLEFDSSRMPKYFSAAADSYSEAYDSIKSSIDGLIAANTSAKNDIMNIKGAGLSGQTKKGQQFKNTPYQAPSNLSDPSIESISGSGSNMISEDKINRIYGSSASATYRDGGFPNGKPDSAGAGAPSVKVHTPVTNKTTIITNNFINQKIKQESGVNYVQLDNTFTVNIEDVGTHKSIPGYGTRKYNSYQAVPKKATNWGKIKDVYLPFDAYVHVGNTKVLIKANTWISETLGASATQNSYTFTVPVWTEEQKYTLKTKVIAENAQPAMYGWEQEIANTEWPDKYVAINNVSLEVVGKIYDLRISNVTDPGWTIKTPGYITAKEFPVGQVGQNANTKYGYAPKLGYTFVFDFKTKGTKSNNIEINTTPNSFYFVGRNGGEAVEVDLYYHTATDNFVKIGGTKDNIDLQVSLKNTWMKVLNQELVDSTRIRGNRYNYGLAVNIGKFSKMILPENLRLSYNNFLEYATDLNGEKAYGRTQAQIAAEAGSKDKVIDSVGHWYAGYRLPASTRALPKGTDITKISNLNNNSKEFLTDGYILVKFDIKTVYKPGSEGYEYLQYIGPESLNEGGKLEETWKVRDTVNNKWKDESPGTKTITLPGGKPATVPKGTIAIFDASLRSSTDVETSGTH